MSETFENWKQKVNGILAQHASTRVNGQKASERTQTMTKEVVFASFRRLHLLGYKIQNPANLLEKHIEMLVRDWWFTQEKSAKTIQNELSRLRVFATWLGKPGMVGKMEKYLHDVDPKTLLVRSAAQSGKSFSAANIDMLELFRRVDARDARLGLMLRMELAFGLRREEALKCQPHLQDKGTHLEILPGQGKGGRTRTISILTEAQRQILDYVKSKIKKGETLGWQYTEYGGATSLKQNLNRYQNLMKNLGITKEALGVTAHGLRAQFAENNALIHQILPPSLGGTKNQHDKDEMQLRLRKLSESMGHHRVGVMSSYYGSFKPGMGGKVMERVTKNIEMVISRMVEIPLVPEDKRADCVYIRNVIEEFGIDLSIRQIHFLWGRWCNRSGVSWMKPEGEIILCLEAAAIEVFTQ